MGLSRMLYGKMSKKLNLAKTMLLSGLLCVICYFLASLSLLPILSLPGCALCGFSVGVMWPGTISLSSQRCPRGGTAMFAFLALAGDPWRYSRPGSARKFLGTVWRQSENRTAGRHNFPDSSGSLLACFEPKDEISHPKVTELQKFQKDTCFMCTFVLCQCRSQHFVCERHYLSVIIKSYETSNLCDI